jgi:gamma-glutamyltranspeptidase / glutathione hydrolase
VDSAEARRFPSGCVASPHYLASGVGLDVLASGGNAVDAAVATNLALGVVTPYLCGYGGDLFALVWAEGRLFAYNGSGRAPSAATVEAVRSAAGTDAMPALGPHAVTVPGAVEGWFALLGRFGSRSFADLAAPAERYAREGFPLTARGGASFVRGRTRFAWSTSWLDVYGSADPGTVLRQPDLARTIGVLRSSGPDAYYRGPIGEAIVAHLRSLGGLMSMEDLADHHGDPELPLRTSYEDVEVVEMPPNTQGVAALEALNISEALHPLPDEGPARQHLLIEATKMALADRDAFVTDPRAMTIDARDIASKAWGQARAAAVDSDRAGTPPTGRPARGGTVYLCAADASGMCVSLIESNYMGFGSGVTVPGWGINLQNRGAYFSLDPAHPNAIGPGKRTLHTLIPAMALRQDRPWLVFGSMGGDGQAQTHLQLLTRILDDGEDIQRAIDAPRWFVDPGTWRVSVEPRFGPGFAEDLRRRGHRVDEVNAFDSLMGHAHAIQVLDDGYAAATDPRAEGAAVGR